jgi:hypothetical protein
MGKQEHRNQLRSSAQLQEKLVKLDQTDANFFSITKANICAKLFVEHPLKGSYGFVW